MLDTPFDNVAAHKNSGLYFGGFAWLEASLDAGDYTIVLSSQDPAPQGTEFQLAIDSIKGPNA